MQLNLTTTDPTFTIIEESYADIMNFSTTTGWPDFPTTTASFPLDSSLTTMMTEPTTARTELATNGTQEYERKFMNEINFTDDMYDILLTGDDRSQVLSACMDSMYEVGQSYRMVHGYISLIVCIAGILMNILIVMVLTRKEMLTPINRMLTALAIADMLVMVEYIPFTLHMYIFELPKEEQYSHLWAVFVLFHSHFTQVLHTINIQLTISMAIWRYLALKWSTKSSAFLTLTRCNLCILAAYICPIIICIPNYLTFSIYHHQKLYLQPPFNVILKMKEIEPGNESNVIRLCEQANEMFGGSFDCANAVIKNDWYIVELSQMAKANNGLLNRINFWTFSVFVKLIPCLVLTFFMCWLVNTLYKAKHRHKMLQRNSGVPLTTIAGSCKRAGGSERHRVAAGSDRHGANGSQHGRQRRQGSLETEQQQLPFPSPSEVTAVQSRKEKNQIVSQLVNGSNSSSSPSSAVVSHAINEPNVNITSSQIPEEHFGNGNNVTIRHESDFHCVRLTNHRDSTNSVDVNDCSVEPPKTSLFSFLLGRIQQRRFSTVSNCSLQPASRTLNHPNNNASMRNGTRKAGKRSDRTSKLLIAVLCLFLLTEFPQGIMAFLSGSYGEQFFKKCYNTWAEVWDILALINSAINFILYCFMSKQFRLQFHNIFNIASFFKGSKCGSNDGVSEVNDAVMMSQRRPTIV